MHKKSAILIVLALLILLSGCSAPPVQPEKAPDPASRGKCPVDLTLPAGLGNDPNILSHFNGKMLFYQGHLYFEHKNDLYRADYDGKNVVMIGDDLFCSHMNGYEDQIYFIRGNKIQIFDLKSGLITTHTVIEEKQDIDQGWIKYSAEADVSSLLIVNNMMFYYGKSGWYGTSGGETMGLWAYDLTTGHTYGPLTKHLEYLTSDGTYIYAYNNGGSVNSMRISDVAAGKTMEANASLPDSYYGTDHILFGKNGLCYVNEDDYAYCACLYEDHIKKCNDEFVKFFDLETEAAQNVSWKSAKRAADNKSLYMAGSGRLFLFKNWDISKGQHLMDLSHVSSMAMHDGKMYAIIQPVGYQPYHFYVFDEKGSILSDYVLEYSD